jgi:glucokinase
MIILAGDIGGTKTWLQIAEYSPEPLANNSPIKDHFRILFQQRYVSAQYKSFDEMLQDFFCAAERDAIPRPQKACIGVAGPVKKGRAGNDIVKVTNLPWKLDAQQLARQYQLGHFHLINDFQAIAFGLEMLAIDEVMMLQEGVASKATVRAPKVVIGAGTGLGQALLVWGGGENGHYEVIPSEGGHGDFAPGSQRQRELLSFLAARQTRVSVEDVLSGRGLVNIYEYFADKYPTDVSEALSQSIAEGGAAAAVSKAGLLEHESLANQALALFVEIYGTQAGNVALTCMATGGIYIAGGIAEKIRDSFTRETFCVAFADKGPMQAVMKTMPVALVLNPQVGLKGAALVASRL